MGVLAFHYAAVINGRNYAVLIGLRTDCGLALIHKIGRQRR